MKTLASVTSRRILRCSRRDQGRTERHRRLWKDAAQGGGHCAIRTVLQGRPPKIGLLQRHGAVESIRTSNCRTKRSCRHDLPPGHTHVLWSAFTPRRLSRSAHAAIMDPENNIFVSAVTFWEIALKHALGKITLEAVTPDDLPEVARRMGFDLLRLDADDAASFTGCHASSTKTPSTACSCTRLCGSSYAHLL